MQHCNRCGRKLINNGICFCGGNSYIPIKNPEVESKPILNNEIPTSRQETVGLTDIYRNLWKELHTYSYQNEQDTKIWLNNWINKIPCGECRNHFKKIIEDFPPKTFSAESFFDWTVQVHNKVNEKLDKKQISLNEAKKIWL